MLYFSFFPIPLKKLEQLHKFTLFIILNQERISNINERSSHIRILKKRLQVYFRTILLLQTVNTVYKYFILC